MQTRTQTRRRARPVKQVNVREIPWNYVFIVVICGAVLAAGFFFAGLQHFTSIEYGIKNSRLRKQIESLEAEKRRLLLAKEVSLSPRELRKAARGISSRNAELVRVAQPDSHLSSTSNVPFKNGGHAVKVSASAEPGFPGQGKAKLVVSTVTSRPVDKKPGDEDRGRIAKEKKEGLEITAVAKLR